MHSADSWRSKFSQVFSLYWRVRQRNSETHRQWASSSLCFLCCSTFYFQTLEPNGSGSSSWRLIMETLTLINLLSAFPLLNIHPPQSKSSEITEQINQFTEKVKYHFNSSTLIFFSSSNHTPSMNEIWHIPSTYHMFINLKSINLKGWFCFLCLM